MRSSSIDGLLNRYAAQPKFGTRTGRSAANQAYSTPAPLAWLLGRFSGANDRVLEPTAGTGMLLIGSPSQHVTLNELDSLRVKLLRAAGHRVQEDHAAATSLAKGPFDVVLMNPPFGKQLDAQGQKTWMSVFADGKTVFRSDSLDESIAANAAVRLKPGGTMVLVMAGPSPQTIEQGNKARADHYAKTHAAFHPWLHRNFE